MVFRALPRIFPRPSGSRIGGELEVDGRRGFESTGTVSRNSGSASHSEAFQDPLAVQRTRTKERVGSYSTIAEDSLGTGRPQLQSCRPWKNGSWTCASPRPLTCPLTRSTTTRRRRTPRWGEGSRPHGRGATVVVGTRVAAVIRLYFAWNWCADTASTLRTSY